MNYFDVYKKKLSNNGSGIADSLKNSGQEYVINEFKDDPTYRCAIHINNECNESDIDIRVMNVDRTVYEKKILLLPNEKVNCGDYISYDEKTYIIEEIEDNLIAPSLKAKFCNQILKWRGLDKIIPCFITNDAYGSKTLLDNVMLSNTDTKAKIIVQDNKYTRQIKRDWRFMFNGSEYDIFKVTDITTSMDEGVITLITKKDKLVKEDDIENNIAFIPDLKEEISIYEIEGNSTIRLNEEETYRIDMEEVLFEIDDETIATITEYGEGFCIVKALMKDEMFILYAKNIDGDVVDTMTISTMR